MGSGRIRAKERRNPISVEGSEALGGTVAAGNIVSLLGDDSVGTEEFGSKFG
jgi:hypothetical protein